MHYFKFLNQTHANLFCKAFEEYEKRKRYPDNGEASVLYLVSLLSADTDIPMVEIFDFDKGIVKMEAIKKHDFPNFIIQVMLFIYNFQTGCKCFEEYGLYPMFDFFATTGYYNEYILEAIGIWFNILDDNEQQYYFEKENENSHCLAE